jgi:hypothetical protein
MARCSCGNATCSCVIQAGSGVTVVGNGSPSRPYEIAVDSNDKITDILKVSDTDTLDLVMVGSGTPSDKVTIYGQTLTKMTDLRDVIDPEGPQTGDVPIWQASGHWEFRPLPSGPPTTVQTSTGITGDGSAGAPVAARTSGTWGAGNPSGQGWPGLDKWGSDDTYGNPIYVSADGKLRSRPLVIPSSAAIAMATAGGSYPIGVSVMSLGATQAAAGGWPGGVSATVVTYRRAVDVDTAAICHQYYYPTSGNPQVLYRRFNVSWTAFLDAMLEDTGWVNLTPSQGTGTFQYRCRNGMVSLRCAMTGVSVASNTNIVLLAAGVIPAAYLPGTSVYQAGSSAGSGLSLGTIGSDGLVSLWNPSYNSGAMTVARFYATWMKE